MHHRIARTTVLLALVAAGHAVFAATEAPAKVRTCGPFRGPSGDPVGVVINRGATRCATASRAIRTYLRSQAPCEGSACVREHLGWTCAGGRVRVAAAGQLARRDAAGSRPTRRRTERGPRRRWRCIRRRETLSGTTGTSAMPEVASRRRIAAPASDESDVRRL